MGNDMIKFRALSYQVGLVSGESFKFTSKDLFAWVDDNTLEVWVNGNQRRGYTFNKNAIAYVSYENVIQVEE